MSDRDGSDNKPTEEPTGTCDWGDCDYTAKFWRWSVEGAVWLPTCWPHSERGERMNADMNAIYKNSKGSFA